MPDGRIVVVATAFDGYGGERVAATLVEELAARFDVTAVQLGASPPPSRWADGRNEFVALPRSGGLGDALALSRAVADVYDRVRPDGVISVMTYANLVALLARRRSRCRPRVVVSEHSITSHLREAEAHPVLMRNAARVLYPTATAVVGVSQTAVDDLTRFLRPARLRTSTILNPCRELSLVDARPSRSGGRGVDGERRLVCVAALKEAKDHELLLRALALLPDDVVLDLVGDGPLRVPLAATAQSLGLADRVRFLGFLDDPAPVVAGARASVLASRWEGFGLVALESAELEVPMVVTPRGALPEVVPRFAPGRVAATASPGDLAAAIKAALDDPVTAPEWERARHERRAHLAPASVADRYAALLVPARGGR